MIVIDKREPDEVKDYILDCPIWQGYNLKFDYLEAGDFAFCFWNRKQKAFQTVALWESKTVSDLMGSMTTKVDDSTGGKKGGRVFKQLVKMQSQGVEAGLLIKGKFETYTYDIDPLERKLLRSNNSYSQSGWSRKSLEGLKLSLLRRGIPVVQLDDPIDLPYYLRWLHDHYKTHRNDTDSFWRSNSSVPVAMLDMIPGIGPVVAQAAHDHFNTRPDSLAGIVTASMEALTNYLGPKLGLEIYRRFH